MLQSLENYEKFKTNLSDKSTINGKGKLAPHRELIEKMIDDDLTQKAMREFLKEEFNLDVSPNNFSAYVRKLKEKKIIKMELVNSGVLPVAAIPVESKKPIKKEVRKIEKVENKIATKKVVVENTKTTNSLDDEFAEIRNKINKTNEANIVEFEGATYNLNSPIDKINYDLAKKAKKD